MSLPLSLTIGQARRDVRRTAVQKLLRRVGVALIRHAEHSAARAEARRAQRSEAVAARRLSQAAAEQRREQALLYHHQGPRQF
ncbi:MAG TPA: hypothetical protein H9871_09575 [Candidatus Nesterenkonia stercoripullorum]|uniref:Uncharacterized protein n=1 Tax=Candidatus Nesterenkonia stercoripullorum TaxID=2838701 RepID=A0A9D1UU09_9MICC|nr:hypothetical protein [Candidatus Nesterenkonia stercoripullorum]